MPKAENNYTAKDIYVLEGLEPVRKRPGMYIGSTGTDGLHHLIWEVVDNSIDEAMAGFAKNIEVHLEGNGRVKVSDDGRGIPVETHAQTKKSALETVMTTLHAGGKFGGESYKVAGGLHGVGVSVVNALSSWLKVEVCRGGALWAQEYKRGVPETKVKKVGACKKNGTTVTFEPDPDIFKTIEYSWDAIISHLRQQAYLTKGIRISVSDERVSPQRSHTFYFEGGIVSYVHFLNRSKPTKQESIFHVEKIAEDILCEIAFQYTDDYQPLELSFANNIHTGEGGMHLTGFRTALTRTLNDYARKNGYLKESDDNLSGDDVREGLTAIVSVKIKNTELQFEGQTKAKLGNTEARSAVESVTGEALGEFLEQNPSEARAILEKTILAQKAREAARAARETVIRKGILEGLALPGKLADCSSRDPKESEIFIVEGDSAGGCFSADTKIALVDGRNLTFTELIGEARAGKQNYCYTLSGDGIEVAPIEHPRVTKKRAALIKIILDNNEEIVCTPDHKFMLRDGSYKEAQNLTPTDSLMPLRRQLSRRGRHITIEGYEMVFDPTKARWIFTHILSDKYNLKRGIYSENSGAHRHHKDFNKRNNNPDNIERLSREKHLRYHARKALGALYEVFQSTGEVGPVEYQKKRLTLQDKSLLRFDTICERFFGGDKQKLKEAVINFNHRVVKIIPLQRREDVYDLEVPGTHSFALASGVFVHNSAKQARDRRFQAILPIRGKILNVEKARLDKMLASKEIKALVIALGAAIAEEFNIEKLRYHRVVLMTDADVDGAHIRTLLLTLFFRYFLPIIEQGYLYIAQPPLYRLAKGKSIEYAYTDTEKDEILNSFKKGEKTDKGKKIPVKKMGREEGEVDMEANQADEADEAKISGVSIQRYKGLGEMNPIQLWETTMDPEKRVLKKVNIEDAEEADRLFDILMGSEVAPRKRFIQTHAKAVKNLDI